MTIYGLSGEGFCINNNIQLAIYSQNQLADRYSIKITNAQTQQSQEFSLSAINGFARTNLAPMIKAMFKKPKHKYTDQQILENYIENSAREVFNFQIRKYLTNADLPIKTISINYKHFFRAGTLYNAYDVRLSMDKKLRNNPTIPYWEGFPCEDYFISESYNIYFTKIESVAQNLKELMPNNTCNPCYVKFLNALGGYSYWLFDSQTKKIKTTNTGFYNNHNTDFIDFGNQIETKLSLFSKVPKRYFNIIQELILSPEIYYYDATQRWKWQQIVNDNNSFELCSDKKFQEVSLSFIQPTNYNPQLSW